LRDHEEEFRSLGCDVAAIGLGSRHYAEAFREDTGITFPLFVDEDRLAYKAVGMGSASLLHLLRKDNAKARKRAKRGGHSQHRLGKDPLQLGGGLVLAPGDRDLYVYLSETFGDNAPIEDMLAAAREASA
jgi:hypothetical protein